MKLKRQLTRLLMVGGLAVMTAGFSQAGGGFWSGDGGGNPGKLPPDPASPTTVIWNIITALL